MCGIAGIYYFTQGNHSLDIEAILPTMTHEIAHRGPDDDGHFIDHNVGLGMRRLSIIDLKSGAQPIYSDDGRYVIVFNGEIYNYRDLKSKLESQGQKFKTNSDTEVILLGWIKHGHEFLHQLEGMFAFSIYDKQTHKIFFARDRLGKKPLYWYKDHEKFLYCSETKALLKVLNNKLSISSQSWWDFLTYRYIPGTQTAYKEIFKLPPGHYAILSGDKFETHQYWKIPKHNSEEFSDQEIQTRFGELFCRASQKRLIADVPVGLTLSGGIDSCAVLYEASKIQKINSYHVFFDVGDNYNELKHAQKMAELAGSTLHTVEVSEQMFIDMIADVADFTDEPLSDLSTIPFKYVCDLAASQVKVVLSGEGSDETLAGYELHNFSNLYERLKFMKLPFFKPFLKTLGPTLFPNKRWDYLDFGLESLASDMNFNITFQMTQEEKQKLALKNVAFEDSARFLKAIYKDNSDQDIINQILHVISSDWLVEDVLMKSDKVSMSSSLEVRCPFLDHELVEFLFKLHGNKKIGKHEGQYKSKILLRRHLENKIPDELIHRKKLGFPVPAYTLESKVYRDFIYDVLSNSNTWYSNFLKQEEVLKLYQSALSQPSQEETKLKHFIWTIVNFETWYNKTKMSLES